MLLFYYFVHMGDCTPCVPVLQSQKKMSDPRLAGGPGAPFLRWVSVYNPGWPGTRVDQADFES